MWWRIKRKQWEKQQGLGNKRAMKEIVKSGEIPGLIAYVGGRPTGWCSVAPREHFPVLDRSPVLKPVDDLPVWSVVCFYIHKDYRRKGLARALLHAAMKFAQEWGAQILEGYPIEPKKDDVPGIYAFTGFSGLFEEMGFKEVARRSEKRPIMRYVFKKDS